LTKLGGREILSIYLRARRLLFENGTAACITSANHDPKQFRDPDRFDPHRENLASILTFGRNAHMCLGRNLATREIDVALRVLCERFPNMELAPHREVVFAGTQFRTCEELWVRLNR